MTFRKVTTRFPSKHRTSRHRTLKEIFSSLRPSESGILTDKEILRAYRRGEIQITPFERDLIRPSALSLRLGHEAHTLVTTNPIDTAKRATYPELKAKELDAHGRLALEPGEVMLAPTLERIAISTRMSGLMDGTSSYARLGISIVLSHQVTPGFGSDCGSVLTLEIVSRLSQTVYLYPGTRICNLMLFRSRRDNERSYADIAPNYARDISVSSSRLAEHLATQGKAAPRKTA